MITGNYTERDQRSRNTVTSPESLGMGCPLPILIPNEITVERILMIPEGFVEVRR